MHLGASPTGTTGAGTTLKEKMVGAVKNFREGRLHQVTLRKLPGEKQKVGLRLTKLARDIVSEDSPLAGGWKIESIPDEGPAFRAGEAGQLRVGEILVRVDDDPTLTRSY